MLFFFLSPFLKSLLDSIRHSQENQTSKNSCVKDPRSCNTEIITIIAGHFFIFFKKKSMVWLHIRPGLNPEMPLFCKTTATFYLPSSEMPAWNTYYCTFRRNKKVTKKTVKKTIRYLQLSWQLVEVAFQTTVTPSLYNCWILSAKCRIL